MDEVLRRAKLAKQKFQMVESLNHHYAVYFVMYRHSSTSTTKIVSEYVQMHLDLTIRSFSCYGRERMPRPFHALHRTSLRVLHSSIITPRSMMSRSIASVSYQLHSTDHLTDCEKSQYFGKYDTT